MRYYMSLYSSLPKNHKNTKKEVKTMATAAWFVLLILFCLYWGGQKLLSQTKTGINAGAFIGTLIVPLLMAFFIYKASIVGVIVVVAFEMLLNFLVAMAKKEEAGFNFAVMILAFAINAGLSLGAFFLVQALR